MSDSSETPWSSSPNAPRIPGWLYTADKVNFAGDSIAAVLYGIVTVIFFQCMAALLDPVNSSRRGIKWGLVVHTTVMFSLATVATGMGLNLQSISHVDNREFPADGQFPPGPLGYKFFIYTKAISLVPNLAFQVNQWLADGLLLYRCYVICGTKSWLIAFPCLMYLTSLAVGIVYMYQSSLPENRIVGSAIDINLGLSYFTVSFALNILLTSMIVIRLILHRRNIRKVMGGSAGVGQLYGAIITILVESSALYAVSFLLFFGPWAAGSWVDNAFWSILFEVQVISPLLITRRVAARRALTRGAIVSGDSSSIYFGSLEESTSGDETLAEGNPATRSTDAYGETLHELSAGVRTTVGKSTS